MDELKTADQITKVENGKVTYTVPEATAEVEVEVLRQQWEQAEHDLEVASINLANATEKRDATKALYDGALAIPK